MIILSSPHNAPTVSHFNTATCSLSRVPLS